MGPYHNQTSEATLGKSVFTVQTVFKLNDRQMGTQTDRQTARETDRQTKEPWALLVFNSMIYLLN